jgi:hypothetical protein
MGASPADKARKPPVKPHKRQFLHAHETLGPEKHHEDQDQGIDEKPVILEETEEFLEVGQYIGGKNRTGHGTHAPQNHKNKEID